MCQATGVSRAGFYRGWEQKAPDQAAMALSDAIQRTSLEHSRYGAAIPAEIKALSKEPGIDRDFDLGKCPINGFLLRRSLETRCALVWRKAVPNRYRRDSEQRQADRGRLSTRLSEKAEFVRSGPEDLVPLARWIQGLGPIDEVGILAPQLLGRLFCSGFTASLESWAAAQVSPPRRDPGSQRYCGGFCRERSGGRSFYWRKW
jgi:hypothetical protein